MISILRLASTLVGMCRLARQGWTVAALLMLGAPLSPALSQFQAPDVTVKSQHGDWQVACKPPPPGAKNEICGLVQTVAAEDDNNIVISVHFQKFSDGKRVIRIYTPTGVALSMGLGLNIDDKQTLQTGFSRCAQYGCLAQIEPDDKLIDLMRNGKKALVVIYRTQEVGIGIPISLSGFGQALAALH